MIPIILLYASLVNDVRSLIARHDEAAAERAVRAYQAHSGATPELAAALSWLARDELAGQRVDKAEFYAAESRKMALQLLGSRRLDSDAWLPTALGGSIEVHAQALAGILTYGGFRVQAGALSMGVVAAFLQYGLRFFRPIQDLSEKYNILQSAMASAERIFKLLDTVPEVVAPERPRPAAETIAPI